MPRQVVNTAGSMIRTTAMMPICQPRTHFTVPAAISVSSSLFVTNNAPCSAPLLAHFRSGYNPCTLVRWEKQRNVSQKNPGEERKSADTIRLQAHDADKLNRVWRYGIRWSTVLERFEFDVRYTCTKGGIYGSGAHMGSLPHSDLSAPHNGVFARRS